MVHFTSSGSISRMRRGALRWAPLAAFCGALVAPVGAQGTELVPFRMPWADTSPGPTDLRFMNDSSDTPLTIGGDGHFYRAGARYRLWGTNITAGGCFPSRAEAEVVAARIAKFGFNAVRLQSCEAYFSSHVADGSLLDYRGETSSRIIPENLDRLDYLVAQLERRGLYVDLVLMSNRRFLPGDSLDPRHPLPVRPGPIFTSANMEAQKPLSFIHPELLAAQKAFATALLTHVNPYTGRAYRDDSALAIVEILNEGGILHSWLWGQLEAEPLPIGWDRVPAESQRLLQRRWNDWLVASGGYSSTAELLERWYADAPVELLRNGQFADGEAEWQIYPREYREVVFEPGTEPGASVLRIDVPSSSTDPRTQVLQRELPVELGEYYELRYSARSSAALQLEVDISLAEDPYWRMAAGGQVTCTSDGEWQDCSQLVHVDEPSLLTSYSAEDLRFGLFDDGTLPHTLWLRELSVQRFERALEAGASLEAGTIPNVSRVRPLPEPARRDWVRFLRDLELSYYGEMRAHLAALGVRAHIVGTQVMNSTPSVQATLDVVDTHGYWDQEHEKRSALEFPPGALELPIAGRIAGKPHIATEVSHLSPNRFSSEGPLLIAAYASLQDFDGAFAFEWGGSGDWSAPTFRYTDFDHHPPRLTNYAVAARLFRNFDVAPARGRWTVGMSPETELDSILQSGEQWRVADVSDRNFPGAAGMQSGVEMDVSEHAVNSFSTLPAIEAGKPLLSDTGQLSWDAKQKLVRIDSPRTRGVIGGSSGERYELCGSGSPGGDGCVVLEPGVTNLGWSTLALTLVQGDGFARDARVLLVATGEGENTDMHWYQDGTWLGAGWGVAPTRIEVIPARVTLPRRAAEVAVYALDGRGQRAARVPVSSRGESASFELGQSIPTLWYEIVLGSPAVPVAFNATLVACEDFCAATEEDASCYQSPLACLSECAASTSETSTSPCDCTDEREELALCVEGNPEAASACDRPFWGSDSGCCAEAQAAYGRCLGNRPPCLAWRSELLDDFEDGDLQPSDPRFARWSLWWDESENPGVSFRLSSPGALGSRHAAAFSFSDPIKGAAVLSSSAAPALDLSGYAGIRFRARGEAKMRAHLFDEHMAEGVWDGFGMDFFVQDEWRDYVLLFDDPHFIQSDGWGPSFDRSAVRKIELRTIGDPRMPEFAIDDVELLRAR